MSHSLEAAVADGTIGAAAAFCGLSPADVAAPAIHPTYCEAKLLVQYRSRTADWRSILPACEVAARPTTDVRAIYPAQVEA